jgi:predicted 3-demethylubiquinone-9 3-methyltransferase (glyoxalase superfamily)
VSKETATSAIQKITPHLWFRKEAKEAAEFHAALIPNSKIKNITTLHNTPSGECDVVSFELSGQPFMAISAGPLFKFNPSVSFHVKSRTKGEVDAMWERPSQGATNPHATRCVSVQRAVWMGGR